jgi:ribonuclease T
MDQSVSDDNREVYISVDVETDGPIPGDYSMLSLGACVVGQPDQDFYVEFKPISDRFVPQALEISGLNRDHLITDGVDPERAMQDFLRWVETICGVNKRPVFVAFNATFDWMFVHWYFEHFVGKNPFGISGWDIKAYYAGITGKKRWSDTSKRMIEADYLSSRPHTHNALDDAKEQAEIFEKLRDQS